MRHPLLLGSVSIPTFPRVTTSGSMSQDVICTLLYDVTRRNATRKGGRRSNDAVGQEDRRTHTHGTAQYIPVYIREVRHTLFVFRSGGELPPTLPSTFLNMEFVLLACTSRYTASSLCRLLSPPDRCLLVEKKQKLIISHLSHHRRKA